MPPYGLTMLLSLLNQLKHLFGIHIPRGSLPMTLYYVVMNLRSMNVFAFALGIGGMLLLHFAKKANTKLCPKIALPEQLLLLILATALVWLLGADEDGSPLRLPVVGQVGFD